MIDLDAIRARDELSHSYDCGDEHKRATYNVVRRDRRALLAYVNELHTALNSANVRAFGGEVASRRLGEELDALRAAAAKVCEVVPSDLMDKCYCHEAYTSRKMIDPNCRWHDEEDSRAALADLRALLEGKS